MLPSRRRIAARAGDIEICSALRTVTSGRNANAATLLKRALKSRSALAELRTGPVTPPIELGLRDKRQLDEREREREREAEVPCRFRAQTSSGRACYSLTRLRGERQYSDATIGRGPEEQRTKDEPTRQCER